jgi:DNA-directed RNA polymerase specialized sigma24 family protein
MASLTLNPIDVLAIKKHTASLVARIHRATILEWTPEQMDALARLRREHAERLNAPASPTDVVLMSTVLETFASEYRQALHAYYVEGASAEEASEQNGLTVEVFAAARILARKHWMALAAAERIARR